MTLLLESRAPRRIARLGGERPLRQSARAPCWHRFGRLPSFVSLSHRRRAQALGEAKGGAAERAEGSTRIMSPNSQGTSLWPRVEGR